MFTENKITEFTNKIADLQDRPQISAQRLKEYFDSSAEELRIKFNALIDALDGFAGTSFANVEYNAADGVLTFTLGDGTSKTIDLPLELLVENGYYDSETQNIVLVLANGNILEIPAGDLVDVYTADDETLTLIEEDGKKMFSVKGGVFAEEAPMDEKSYVRKNGAWATIKDCFPEITLEEADSIYEGVYKVRTNTVSSYEGGEFLYTDTSKHYGVLLAAPFVSALNNMSTGDALYDASVEITQTILWEYGTIERRVLYAGLTGADSVVENEDGSYGLSEDFTTSESWTEWEDVSQTRLDSKENKWILSRTVTVNTPIWKNQPLIATLSEDGTTVESTREITAEDLTEYDTTETNYYKIALTNTDGSALPDGCFRVLDVFTSSTSYNADLATVFYLEGYNTGNYTFETNNLTRLVDFVASDAGVKQFRKAGDTVSFSSLSVNRMYKVNIDGFMGAANDANVYLALCGYAGMRGSDTKCIYPHLGTNYYTQLSTQTSTNATGNAKVGIISATLEMCLQPREVNTTCIAHVKRTKDKLGTGSASSDGTRSVAKETRVPWGALPSGLISFEGGGNLDFILLNGTTLKLYYKDI